MRRFLAYTVMMLTMVCALIFNTQAILDRKTDAMEYGSATEMVYSITYRNKADYEHDGNTIDEDFPLLQDIDIEKEVMDRLDLAGIRNASVRIVEGNEETQEGYQLRIALSPLNESELGRIKEVIGITGSLSIGTIGDDTVYYASNGTFFDYSGDFATIEYNGTTPYPSIKVIPEDYDKLKEAAKEAAEAHKNDKLPDSGSGDASTQAANRFAVKEATTETGDGTEEDTNEDETTVYLWSNKTVNDTYNKAFGVNDTVIQEEVKDKVIAKLDLNNYNSETQRLAILSDMEGNAFDIASARAFVNMLNAKDYGFDIEFLYQNIIPATFGQNGVMITYIISGSLLVIISILLILFYGLAGVSSSLNLLASVLFSFFLFSVLGFEFSVAALVGLCVLAIQSVFISVNYFERVKIERRRGRGFDKANREGYHKSFFASLDSSAVIFLSSLFCFLLATGPYKTLLGVIMVGSIFTFLITNFVNKWTMYWLCKDVQDAKNNSLFFGKIKNKEKAVKFVSEKNNGKRRAWLIPLIAALAIGITLPTGYFLSKDGSFFNNKYDFASDYTFNVSFSGGSQKYEDLAIDSAFVEYIEKIGQNNAEEKYVMYAEGEEKPANLEGVSFTYNPDSVFVNIVEKKDEEGNTYYNHYFTFTTDQDLSALKLASGRSVTDFILESMKNEEIVLDDGKTVSIGASYSHYELDSLKVGCYLTNPTNVTHNYNNMFLLVFLVSVFAALYILVRYGLSIAMTSLVTGTVASALFVSFLVLFQIPFASYTGFALVASALLLNAYLVLVLGGNKETLKEMGIRKTATPEQRREIANDIAKRSLRMTVPCVSITALMGVGLFFVNPDLSGLSIALILFSALVFALSYFFATPFYSVLASHKFFKALSEKIEKHREKKGKKKEAPVVAKDGIVYVDSNGPHETIIPGMNDFRYLK